MDFPDHISPRIPQFFAFHKEENLKTVIFIVLLINLGYVALGWRNRR